MAFCKFCGSQIHDESVFCSNCGKRLSGSAQSVQYPPQTESGRQRTETAEQRAQRYQNESYRNNVSYGNTGGNGGSAPQKTSMKVVIPVALVSFIAVLMLFNSLSNRSSSAKKVVPTPLPAVSISIPPEIYGDKPVFDLPEGSPKLTNTPGQSGNTGYDEDEFYESIADNVLAVLEAITERSDYILGDFEPLIGVTNVNKNGHAEILAVYEAKDDGAYEVRYDVWSADAQLTNRVMTGVLFFEVGGNSGVVYLLQDSVGAPYVMLEQTTVSGEYFQKIYDLYKFSGDETTVDYYGAWAAEGRYDTVNGGSAESKYYMMKSDWSEISADDFEQSLNEYTIVYSLDILSGDYDWDNTLSFDWAWKAFGQER